MGDVLGLCSVAANRKPRAFFVGKFLLRTLDSMPTELMAQVARLIDYTLDVTKADRSCGKSGGCMRNRAR